MFSTELKKIRKSKSITQTALASTLGVTQQAVAKWEAGLSYPDKSILIEISKFFCVSMDTLFGVKSSTPIGFHNIPIIGYVRAGYSSAIKEEHGTYEPACVPNPHEYFYFLVQGDSMEPQIRHMDLALVHRQSYLDDGDIGVVIYGDNDGTVKKFRKYNNKVELVPFNKKYDPLVIEGEDLKLLFVFGKVIETKTKW